MSTLRCKVLKQCPNPECGYINNKKLKACPKCLRNLRVTSSKPGGKAHQVPGRVVTNRHTNRKKIGVKR